MHRKMQENDGRSVQQIEEHYRIEKELADRLRHATREERRRLYSIVYEELFAQLPQHPMLTRKASAEETAQAVAGQMKLLKRFLTPETIFLEVGAGDCQLTFAVAGWVKKAYAVEVSSMISASATRPPNFELILSDGLKIDLPDRSVGVAYSNQLMEHLHPDDAFEQLCEIYRVLAPGGIYLCLTPNSLTGPHDISRYFDSVATGFHLKEYSIRELTSLFRSVGFSRLRFCFGVKGRFLPLPIPLYRLMEMFVYLFPASLRKIWSQRLPFRLYQDLRLLGVR
jgi:SAM-dependent methyltransferase